MSFRDDIAGPGRRPLLVWVIEQLGTQERPPAVLARRLRALADTLEAHADHPEPPWGEARREAQRAQAEAQAEARAEEERVARLARAARLDAQPAVAARPGRNDP